MFGVRCSFSRDTPNKSGTGEMIMSKKTFWAHQNHTLAKHLNDTGKKAERFARAFHAGSHGQIAGVLHDLGKAEEEFQKRILSDDKVGEKQPHAHHGAMIALAADAWPIALAINGHHAGLHNRGDVESKKKDYLHQAQRSAEALQESDPSWALPEIKEELPSWLTEKLEFNIQRTSEGWLAADFFTRLLFSALIDADRLDTEEFDKGSNASIAARCWKKFDADEFLAKLTTELNQRFEKATSEGKASAEVLNVRKEVGEFVWERATEDRGLFSMTVPTGGGKTLASVLFALKHAASHNAQLSPDDPTRFRRIIVVIPYLSIIEQTADELIKIFGEDVVLEHHSQAEKIKGEEEEPVKKEKQDGRVDAKAKRRRLAAENWDAPIVVTTSVQFFGSLFSRRPSKARKLHNICQSVVIFDEVQTLPPQLLQPLLGALSELSNPERPYGCSLLFCTATQPALGQSDDLPCGLENIRPVIPPERAKEHFRQLARVEYEGLQEEPPVKSWEELASKMLATPNQQALAIVNTRRDARLLHEAVRIGISESDQSSLDGLFHLSTWMMASHRREVLKEVRRRLDDASKPRGLLVSTQCIEAGVDVDFPEAWRAFGPYDSIVQAAGRCNRNGLRSEKGVVHVFRPKEENIPPGLYQTAVKETDLLRKKGLAQPFDPDSFERYFRSLYQSSVPEIGECPVQKARGQFHFQKVDELFDFIDDDTFSVLILHQTIAGEEYDTEAKATYDSASRRPDGGFFVREDWRAMQGNIVNLPFDQQESLLKECLIAPAFNDSNSYVWIWQGSYQGGLDGCGLIFDALPIERTIL